MADFLQTQVLIVGAGPVGLSLAIDLARRGIDVLVKETRHRGEPPSVKCNHVSARTMEIFRRLVMAAAMRSGKAGAVQYGRRMATVEPVFANLRHSKRLDRFTLRGQPKVNTQWALYCLVHNIEKLARHGHAR